MKIHVKPAEGARVRNPDAGHSVLPAEGDTVLDTPYWREHAAQGSVTISPAGARPGEGRAAKAVKGKE